MPFNLIRKEKTFDSTTYIAKVLIPLQNPSETYQGFHRLLHPNLARILLD